MLKRVKKLWNGLSSPKEKPTLATIMIHPIAEKDPPEEPISSEQQIQDDEEFKSMHHGVDSIHQDLGVITSDIMQPNDDGDNKKQTKEPTVQLELDSAIFDSFSGSSGSFGSSGSSGSSKDDESMTDSSMDTTTNQAFLDAQAECIAINNESLQTQYEQLLQNQANLQEQQHVNNCNQALATQLQEQIHELYATLHQLQQQVYYHRHELDRLAEQAISYEGLVQRHQKTIQEQERLVGSLGYVCNAQPNVNQLTSMAYINGNQ